MQTLRQTEILELARRNGLVQVEPLAERFGVSVQTIRRDLRELSDAGRLERQHGGAVVPSSLSNIVYAERRALNNTAKAQIADLMAARIAENSAICLNIGTTTEAVAHALVTYERLLVVTNNVHVAQIMGANPTCKIVLTGGNYRPTDGGLVGREAVATIRGYKFDHAIIGCSAIDRDGDMLDFDPDEVDATRAIMAAARFVTLVVDHSKLSRAAPIRVANIADVDQVVTNQPLPPALMDICAVNKSDVVYPGS